MVGRRKAYLFTLIVCQRVAKFRIFVSVNLSFLRVAKTEQKILTKIKAQR